MNQGIAVVVNLAARRGKLPFALREQPAAAEQAATTREQIAAECVEFLLNKAIDLQTLYEAEGMTPAQVRQELVRLTGLFGIFGEASNDAIKLLFTTLEAPESA